MVCFFHSLKLSIQFDFQFLFVCLFFCLDRQSRATFPTNQIQTKTNGALVDRVFRTSDSLFVLTLSYHWLLVYFLSFSSAPVIVPVFV